MIGLRVERPDVFDATHRRVFDWLAKGELDGVRVDHPDGLRDPQQYFSVCEATRPMHGSWRKRYCSRESLRADWPIEGTTGYDFLNVCNRLLVDDDGLKELTEIYRDFIRDEVDFESQART